MKLPPIDKATLQRLGCKHTAPMQSVVGNLNIERKPKKQRELSSGEARVMFGDSLAVKMNFIPQMMIAFALDEAGKFVNNCRYRQITEFKKHTRAIQACIEEYTRQLRDFYGEFAFEGYIGYVSDYFDYVWDDRLRMRMDIENIVNRCIGKNRNSDSVAKIAIVHNILDYVENYEKRMDKVIADKTNQPVHWQQNPLLQIIIAMCIEFEEEYGYKIDHDPTIDAWMKLLANRASVLADRIIEREK